MFAGGDAVTGADLAVRAVAAGRLAAVSIDQYLGGRPVQGDPEMLSVVMGKLNDEELAEFFREIEEAPRAPMPELPLEERVKSFAEVELGLSEDAAIKEAGRCMNCGCWKASVCSLRQYATEYGADPLRFAGSRRSFRRDSSHPEIVYEPGKCILCGACVKAAAETGAGLGLAIVGRGFDATVAVPLEGHADRSSSEGRAARGGSLPHRRLRAKRRFVTGLTGIRQGFMTRGHARSCHVTLTSVALLQSSLIAYSARAPFAQDWPMWGGTPQRNMASSMKDLPSSWDVATMKNIKWKAELGDQSYGNPVVAGGKIFVGTNNQNPRNPAITGDKGVLMCFAEADGKFLWQAVTDKLASGEVNDWPEVGVCSSPAVEGNRLYYVTNRGELVCLDTEGFMDGKNDGPYQDEVHKGPTDADIVWKLDMMKELGVFQHNMASSSPIVWGNLVFLETSNGRDASHEQHSRAECPELHRRRQKHRQGRLAGQQPGRPDPPRPVVVSGARRGRRSHAGLLPRR